MSKVFKFGNHLKEIRLHLCQTGKGSAGVRDFVKTMYVPLKKENPNFPILIRECSGIQPKLWARYEMGKENSVTLTNLSAGEVMNQIQKLSQN